MTGNDSQNLQVRLKNCLQTILDLEPDLEQLELGHVLLKEYSMLKSYVDRIGDVSLDEDDVRRIETATANFLDELRTPLALTYDPALKRRRMQ